MSEKGLLFIPDISGYTKFINQTELDHSSHIISELLELILDNNTLNLQLAEVEGDALFMYCEDGRFTFEDIQAQTKKMFMAFHEHLLLYKHRRICNCGACSTANELSLKFIVHAASFDFIEVAGTKKPYGPEVVKIHRLLKNEVPNDEYVLFSEETIEQYNIDVTQDSFEKFQSVYDFGSFVYFALDISKLKLDLPLIPSYPVTKSSELLINFNMDIDAPIDDVYEIASNLAYRAEWNPSLESLDYAKNRVNRAGELHTCVVNGSTVEFETLRPENEENHLVYAERTKSAPFTNQLDNFYVFTETSTGTNLETSIFVTFKKKRKWMKPLIRKFLKKELIKGISELKKLAEETGLKELQRKTH